MAKADRLFVTEAECAERIGLSTEEYKRIVDGLERDGFPRKDPVFCDRRYWPAVRSFLDRRYGLGDDGSLRGPPGLDEIERWKKKQGSLK